MKQLTTIRIMRIVNGFMVIVGEESQYATYCKTMKEARGVIAEHLARLESEVR